MPGSVAVLPIDLPIDNAWLEIVPVLILFVPKPIIPQITSDVPRVEINGWILNLDVKKPAIALNNVHAKIENNKATKTAKPNPPVW